MTQYAIHPDCRRAAALCATPRQLRLLPDPVDRVRRPTIGKPDFYAARVNAPVERDSVERDSVERDSVERDSVERDLVQHTGESFFENSIAPSAWL